MTNSKKMVFDQRENAALSDEELDCVAGGSINIPDLIKQYMDLLDKILPPI